MYCSLGSKTQIGECMCVYCKYVYIYVYVYFNRRYPCSYLEESYDKSPEKYFPSELQLL